MSAPLNAPVVRPAWRVVAEDVVPLPAGTPLGRQVAPLLRNLTLATGTGWASLWLPEQADSPTEQPWAPVDAVPTAAIRAGTARAVAVHDGQGQTGALLIGNHSGHPPARVPGELLDQTADCVTVLLREARAVSAAQERIAEAQALVADAVRIESDLVEVLEAERLRLAGWMLTGATRRLEEVTRHYEAFADAVDGAGGVDRVDRVDADPGRLAAVLADLRRAVDVLIEEFREVVRAVHPVALRAWGASEALRDLEGRLARPVRRSGDLGRRVGWEVESGVYHAVAAVLDALPAGDGPELAVHYTRSDGRFAVRVTDPVGVASAVRAALAPDARRLAALGGGLRVEVDAAGGLEIHLWLPERLSGSQR
ncbi:hypothetical protein [Frankia sp. AiPa1]|uniref:hypothetical protein n=1 Tax=Frankia sp. AiPa1 TaxID=573492 RepID=UPI00202ADFB9|nr:hypothetical protein [Frankia sp. AiPa1]MCL9762937.1 hypothetical protein [Frankia sp. AiPa1]